MTTKFYGKYHGVVVNRTDPMQLGRIQAMVPDVFGTNSSGWAMPCVPCHLPHEVGSALPAVGAEVWIEFEQGDPNLPIWSGCFYGTAAQIPAALRSI